MSFWVRSASNRDVEQIVEIVRLAYEEYDFGWYPDSYHADLYDVEAHFWRKGHMFWVAESLLEEGRVLGTCGLHVLPAAPLGEPIVEVEGIRRVAGSDCSLERMYVRSEARGTGVGWAMFAHCVNSAVSAGLKRMEIWSDVELTDGHAFYERCGAVKVGERLCHDPQQSPEFGFVFDLRTFQN